MTLQEARKILSYYETSEHFIYSNTNDNYIYLSNGSSEIIIDGSFTIEELEAILVIMKSSSEAR